MCVPILSDIVPAAVSTCPFHLSCLGSYFQNRFRDVKAVAHPVPHLRSKVYRPVNETGSDIAWESLSLCVSLSFSLVVCLCLCFPLSVCVLCLCCFCVVSPCMSARNLK